MRAIFFLVLILLLAGCVSQVEQANQTTENKTWPMESVSGQMNGTMNVSDMIMPRGNFTVETSNVTYFRNTTGFLAKPREKGDYPGIIMIHEWWGLNDNIKDTAEDLAAEGYMVLAVDLYKGRVATNSTEARTLVSSLNQSVATENMLAAASYLKNESATSLASLGWCFGGGQSLQLAISGEKLDATVIYYGNVGANETQLSVISWPILGIFGEEDTAIPVASVYEFDGRLNNSGIEHSIYIYPGVGHAFANPSGANYAANETMDAWDKTLAFLKKNLK